MKVAAPSRGTSASPRTSLLLEPQDDPSRDASVNNRVSLDPSIEVLIENLRSRSPSVPQTPTNSGQMHVRKMWNCSWAVLCIFSLCNLLLLPKIRFNRSLLTSQGHVLCILSSNLELTWIKKLWNLIVPQFCIKLTCTNLTNFDSPASHPPRIPPTPPLKFYAALNWGWDKIKKQGRIFYLGEDSSSKQLLRSNSKQLLRSSSKQPLKSSSSSSRKGSCRSQWSKVRKQVRTVKGGFGFGLTISDLQ